MIVSELFPLLVGTISCALAVVVATSGQKGNGRRIFSAFSFSMGGWAMGISIFLLTTDVRIAHWAAVGYYIAALLLIYSFLLFCLSRSEKHSRVPRRPMLWYGMPILLMIGITLLPGGLIEAVNIDTVHTVSLQPIAYAVYCIIFAVYSVAAFLTLGSLTRAKRSGLRRGQHLLIMQVMSVSLPMGAFFNLLLPLLGNYRLIMVGPLFILPIVVVIFYGIMRHRLFDIRSAVARSVTYFTVLALMVGLYFAIVITLSVLMHQSFAHSVGVIINAGAAVILALIFQPAKRFFDRLTSRFFYRDNYNTDDFFAQINHELSVTTDLRGLLQRAASVIGGTLTAEQSFFFVRYGEGRFMTAGTLHHSKLSLADLAILDAHVAEQGRGVILTEDLPEGSTVSALLLRHKVSIALPLMLGEGEMGYLFLGPQRSRSYVRRDVRLLETIADELSIAIQNALSIQDVEEINTTLQQRIEDATRELRASNAQLQQLDEAKDEFVSMASHQLRTPLTSVKGYIDMVLEGDAGPITDMQRQLLSEAFTSSERMVHLINDFLNVSRLQTGKFMIDRRPIDLAKITAQEVESLQTTARAHDLKLKFRAPAYFPVLYIDEGKIRQVIMNFIDNAIYYSTEFSTVRIELALNEGDAVLKVHNDGIGVPKAEQAHLFTKFFRATNARKQRPDGTGVGLFLAKKVIVAHGGSMVFESVEGEGSTFGFRLPVKKLSLAPAGDADELDN
jgi:signal transduction histidine kinase